METQEKYINPFTDFGFKRLFGQEVNKDLLIDFLNELLRDNEGEITELSYKNPLQNGNTKDERKAIFDLYCVNQKGERFIVEMQKTKQDFFKDRALYYSTFPIQEQAQRAEWDFELKAVYTVAILDFAFDQDQDDTKVRHEIKLKDIHTNKVFYDKLTFIYLTMPRFTKTLKELKTRFDKWLYVIKNLPKLDRLPDELRENVFEKFFEAAAIAKLSPDEHKAYRDSLKNYRDLQNILDTARRESKEEGLKEGKEEGLKEGMEKGMEKGKEEGAKETYLEIAKSLKAGGMPDADIEKYTKLPISEIKKL